MRGLACDGVDAGDDVSDDVLVELLCRVMLEECRSRDAGPIAEGRCAAPARDLDHVHEGEQDADAEIRGGFDGHIQSLEPCLVENQARFACRVRDVSVRSVSVGKGVCSNNLLSIFSIAGIGEFRHELLVNISRQNVCGA